MIKKDKGITGISLRKITLEDYCKALFENIKCYRKTISKKRGIYNKLKETKTPISIEDQKLMLEGFAPMKATPQVAGFDLRSLVNYISSRGIQVFRTILKTELPAGYYGRIAPRSILS